MFDFEEVTTDYVGLTAAFLMEAHEPAMALDTAEVFARIAIERADFSQHQFWKFVFDRIEAACHRQAEPAFEQAGRMLM